MALSTCKNCKQKFAKNYCNNCGQSSHTHPINFQYLVHELQHGFFHVDKGILFTLKELFTRPGDSIREFIEGKRVNHFKPVISLVIILATIYGLLAHYFDMRLMDMNTINVSDNSNLFQDILKINKWISDHFVWVSLLSIPIYSLGTSIAFRKQKINFVEHIVLNTFLAGQKLAVHIAAFPIAYLIKTTSYTDNFNTLLTLIDFFLLVWTYKNFFNQESKVRTIWLAILSYIIYIIALALIAVGTVAIVYLINHFKEL